MTIPGAARADLPDPDASWAVLFGVSEYAVLPGLPAVANNLATLRRVLVNPELWGLPEEHCLTLLNPTSIEQVLDAVHTAASAAQGALLFYFAGHGLPDDRFDLHLTLPGSDIDRLYRAVRYDDVRREVVSVARAPAKVVILDCCFSGRALQGGMSGAVDLADHARAEGTYLMTATAETKMAIARPGEEYTAFTGTLLDKLLHGVPNGPDPLDMETLFYHVRADLQARHLPVPQQRVRNDGKAIALVRNRSVGRAPVREPATRHRELPQPPADLEHLLRHPPRELAAAVNELRDSQRDDVADQLLAASGALRDGQEVAAIIELLSLADRPEDLQRVATAAARRPPTEVLTVLDALGDLDSHAEARQLLRAVGMGAADDVASLARLLQERQRTQELTVLLDAALDTAQEHSALIDLVNVLWVAGLRGEVDALVARAGRKLPEQTVVDLADELRAVGREDAAFGLYAAAAVSTAKRPLEAVAQLCQAMAAAGRIDYSLKVATAVIDTAEDVSSFCDVAMAFLDADQSSTAGQALAWAATRLPVGGVMDLAARLRMLGRDEAAFEVCLWCATRRPVDDFCDVVAALRDTGRPVDANKLLTTAARLMQVHNVAALLDRTSAADHERVRQAALSRDPHDVAELLNIIPLSVEQKTHLLPSLMRQLNPQSKEQLLANTVAAHDGDDIAVFMRYLSEYDAKTMVFYAAWKGGSTLASLTAALRPGSNSSDPILGYLLGHPLPRIGIILNGLHQAGLGMYIENVLQDSTTKARGDHAIASQIASLFDAGDGWSATLLLGAALAGRSPRVFSPYSIDQKDEDLRGFVEELRRQSRIELLVWAAAWIRSNCARWTSYDANIVLGNLGLGDYVDRDWRGRGR